MQVARSSKVQGGVVNVALSSPVTAITGCGTDGQRASLNEVAVLEDLHRMHKHCKHNVAQYRPHSPLALVPLLLLSPLPLPRPSSYFSAAAASELLPVAVSRAQHLLWHGRHSSLSCKS